ncbi:hypothetical protein B0H14DRAFT_2563672 [Mycena olivaceomarginata]|nr:hypothetical protein B0H14DRAFT_2563672 [Mycena olivaceomarginata]
MATQWQLLARCNGDMQGSALTKLFYPMSMNLSVAQIGDFLIISYNMALMRCPLDNRNCLPAAPTVKQTVLFTLLPTGALIDYRLVQTQTPKRASGRARRAPVLPDKTPPPPPPPAVPRRRRHQPDPPAEPRPALAGAEDPPVDPIVGNRGAPPRARDVFDDDAGTSTVGTAPRGNVRFAGGDSDDGENFPSPPLSTQSDSRSSSPVHPPRSDRRRHHRRSPRAGPHAPILPVPPKRGSDRSGKARDVWAFFDPKDPKATEKRECLFCLGRLRDVRAAPVNFANLRGAKVPSLPRSYSQSLNDVVKTMLVQNPGMRPSAAKLLKHERIRFATERQTFLMRKSKLGERELAFQDAIRNKDAEIYSLALNKLKEDKDAEIQSLNWKIHHYQRREAEMYEIIQSKQKETKDAFLRPETELLEALETAGRGYAFHPWEVGGAELEDYKTARSLLEEVTDILYPQADKSVRTAASLADLEDQNFNGMVVSQIMEMKNPQGKDSSSADFWEWIGNYLCLDMEDSDTRDTRKRFVIDIPSPLLLNPEGPEIAANVAQLLEVENPEFLPYRDAIGRPSLVVNNLPGHLTQ